ncbi:MAG: SDR family NAD(P)-dependent oxidoreductase [Desulfobacterales bacterium]
MIIITGAGSGIGQFLFQHFSKIDNACGTTHSFKVEDPRFTQLDVSDYLAIEKWRDSIDKNLLSKTVLINCAGTNYDAFAHKADMIEWEKVIHTNFIGSFNVIRCFLPVMRGAGYGRIINIGSITAQMGVMGTSAYAASKSALWGLTKALAAENASKGITVNTINLGYFEIGMGLTQISESQKKVLLQQIPAGRFGSAKEILSTIEYLIYTEYINGTSIDLNGALF